MNEDAEVTEAPPPHPRWCLGLPFAGVAPLEAHEREAVRRRTRAVVARALGCALLTIVVPGPCLLALSMRGTPEGVQAACGVVGLLAFLVGAAATALSTLEGVREGARLRRDVRQGEVLVFRGEPPAPSMEEGLSGPTVELRVLPASRMWLKPGDHGTTLRGVQIQHAALPPSYAWRVPIHDDLVPRGASRDLRFEQRRLTASEVREIVAYAQRLVVPGLGEIAYVLGASLILASPIVGMLRHPNGVRSADDGFAALGAFAFLPVVLFLYGRRVRLARKLRVDLQAGRAVTAVPTADGESRGPITAREFLPVSGVTWTFAGRPASWRNAPPEGPSAVVGA